MTSLIDVIFLLLLFFMLSSTFSRFAEVDIAAAGAGQSVSELPDRVMFLRIEAEQLSLNGAPIAAAVLASSIQQEPGPTTVLIAVTQAAKAQALTDVLVSLRGLPDVTLSVLEAS